MRTTKETQEIQTYLGDDFLYDLSRYEYISGEMTKVVAGTRKLKARWSIELEQDLMSLHGIDVDKELADAMSYELEKNFLKEYNR